MPSSLHLHVPAICKRPHELYFHKVNGETKLVNAMAVSAG